MPLRIAPRITSARCQSGRRAKQFGRLSRGAAPLCSVSVRIVGFGLRVASSVRRPRWLHRVHVFRLIAVLLPLEKRRQGLTAPQAAPLRICTYICTCKDQGPLLLDPVWVSKYLSGNIPFGRSCRWLRWLIQVRSSTVSAREIFMYVHTYIYTYSKVRSCARRRHPIDAYRSVTILVLRGRRAKQAPDSSTLGVDVASKCRAPAPLV